MAFSFFKSFFIFFFTLLLQRLELLLQEANLIEAKLASDANSFQNVVQASMGLQANLDDAFINRQDKIRGALDNFRDRLENRAGSLQDFLGDMMEERAERNFEKLAALG